MKPQFSVFTNFRPHKSENFVCCMWRWFVHFVRILWLNSHDDIIVSIITVNAYQMQHMLFIRTQRTSEQTNECEHNKSVQVNCMPQKNKQFANKNWIHVSLECCSHSTSAHTHTLVSVKGFHIWVAQHFPLYFNCVPILVQDAIWFSTVHENVLMVFKRQSF